MRPTRRPVRVLRWVAVVVGVWMVVAIGSAVLAGLTARTGLRSLQAVRGAVGDPPPSGATLDSQLGTATHRLRRAGHLLGSPLAWPMRLVPWVGPDVTRTSSVLGKAAGAADAQRRVVKAANAVKVRNGCVARQGLLKLAAEARRAQRSSESLVDALQPRSSIDSVERRLAAARVDAHWLRTTNTNAVDAMTLLSGLLFEKRTALLLVLTPSEGRGSGGVIGNFAELQTDGGCVTLGKVGRTTELNPAPGTTGTRLLGGEPGFVARYTRFDAANTWQNLTMSPHFPSVAAAAAALYPQSGGRPVDLVVAVDPFVLAAIVSATGPVAVPGLDQPLNEQNVVRLLAHDLYQTVTDEASNLERIAVLASVVDRSWTALASSSPDPIALGRAMAPVISGRHLQAWSASPAEQELINDLGISGAFTPLRTSSPSPDAPDAPNDAVTVTTNNGSASKLEWYLHRSIDVAVERGSIAQDVRSTVTIGLRNDAPSVGSDYIIGNDVGLPPGTSRLYVSVFTPLDLVSSSVDGALVEADQENELDRYVYSVWVDIAPGASTTIVMGLQGSVADGPYRLIVDPPPLIRPDQVTVTVRGPGRRRVTGVGNPGRNGRVVVG